MTNHNSLILNPSIFRNMIREMIDMRIPTQIEYQAHGKILVCFPATFADRVAHLHREAINKLERVSPNMLGERSGQIAGYRP